MSRLVINIEHTNDGKLAFGVQSDNADQQVALLQHQLAGFQETRDELAVLRADNAGMREALTNCESECADLREALKQVDRLAKEREDAEKARLARAKRRR